MIRTAPAFWAQPAGVLANILQPLGAGWGAVARLRQTLSRPYCAPVPVVCIGNLVAGGAGKTPVVLAMASHLAGRGLEAHIVTRGYSGRLGGPLQVDLARHDAAAIGDEALLLAARAPCWVARDRPAGVRAAIAAGAGIVILDDGFQNPTVAKDFSFVVVDSACGFGNGRVIPAGPLRESPARGLARADALVMLDAGPYANRAAPIGIGRELPVLRAVLTPVAGERLAGQRLLAFAGIGHPEKFFATVRDVGAVLVGSRAFPDHYPFRIAEIEKLLRDAERAQARLVTTAKDIVRVPPTLRAGIEVLEVELRWAHPAAMSALLEPTVRSAFRQK